MRHAEWRFEERDCPICAESCATAIPLGRRGGAAHQLALGAETGIVETWRSRVAAGRVGELGVSPRLAVATAEPRLVENHDFVYSDKAGPAKRA